MAFTVLLGLGAGVPMSVQPLAPIGVQQLDLQAAVLQQLMHVEHLVAVVAVIDDGGQGGGWGN